jgi:aspartyl-tRNA(Asn)/glutamyl-tRNA(Gln) amidotransferase subunit A
MNFEDLTIEKAHQGILKKEFSAVELTKFFLEKIEKENSKIFAFLKIDKKAALSKAEETDKKILNGEKISYLEGIPCAIKDNILVEGLECTAGSKILKNYIAPYDATAVKKLKEKGAIILGKTNLDEFAMGSSTEYSAFGPTKNPIDLKRSPGGSSGGSAAAVASNFCLFALGSDTGGSIRQPAAFCGIVGFKPTYGAVSRFGLIAFASSLDQIGPMAKTVRDCEIVFEAIKGKDEMDSTSIEIPSSGKFSIYSLKEIKIGVPKEYFIKGIDFEVEKAVKKAIKEYEGMGAKIEEISLPHIEYALPCYFILAPAEASSNLARYDGIKYGYSKNPKNKTKNSKILDVYFESRGEGFGQEVKRRIMLGTFTLSAGYFEAYYLRAQKVRFLIKRDFEEAFKKVDFIITPTTPTPPFLLGEKLKDPILMYLSDIFTVPANLVGLPAISIPCGRIGKLPVGFQIIGPALSDFKLLQVAKFYESARSN